MYISDWQDFSSDQIWEVNQDLYPDWSKLVFDLTNLAVKVVLKIESNIYAANYIEAETSSQNKKLGTGII